MAERAGLAVAQATGDAKELVVRNAVLLRGMAAILIIVKHTLGRALTIPPLALQPVYVIANAITDSAVPIFLLLSGFTLSLGAGRRMRVRKYGNLVLKRILPAYTIWYFAYRLLWSFKHAGQLGPLELARQYLTLTDNWQLWFLVLLAQLYLLFPLLFRLYSSRPAGKALILGVFAVVSVGGRLLDGIDPASPVHRCFSPLFSQHTLYFVLGFYLMDYAPLLVDYARKHLVLVSCLGLSAAIKTGEILAMGSPSLAEYQRSLESVGPLRLLDNLLVFVLLFALADRVWTIGGRTKRYLSGYGLYSYGIYLAHIVPMAFSYTALRLIMPSDNDLVLIVNMIATIVLSKLLVQWLSRAPLAEYYT